MRNRVQNGRETFDRRVDMAASMDQLVGDTPILLVPTAAGTARLGLKLEYFNPGGSAKDRPAFAMVAAAERDGVLREGSVIVESTAGNTGAGLALAASGRYRCVFVMPDKISSERQNLLRALGAEVVVAPHNVEPDNPRSYYSVTDRLVREIPNAVKLDQYRNINNPVSHEQTTGPEIWRQTHGEITHLVAPVGTGGTICGTARFLKRQNSAVSAIGVEPSGSVFQGDEARSYLVEGFGEDFWPDNVDAAVIDTFVTVTDAECFAAARWAAREIGVFVGGSSGAALHAARELAATLSPSDLVVAILPDGGRGYLSRFYDDEWMERNGFESSGQAGAAASASFGDAVVVPSGVSADIARKALKVNDARVAIVADRPVDDLRIGEVKGVLTVDILDAHVDSSVAVEAIALPASNLVGARSGGEAVAAVAQRDGWALITHDGLVVGVEVAP